MFPSIMFVIGKCHNDNVQIIFLFYNEYKIPYLCNSIIRTTSNPILSVLYRILLILCPVVNSYANKYASIRLWPWLVDYMLFKLRYHHAQAVQYIQVIYMDIHIYAQR